LSDSTTGRQVDWRRLLDALDEHDRSRFDNLLRRSLKRQLALMRDGSLVDVPDYIRAQAVGEWRRRFVQRGGTKAAARRKTYDKLRNDKNYRKIERDLLSRHLGNILKRRPVPKIAVNSLSLEDACDAYRSLHPRLAGSPLGAFVNEVCERALGKGGYRDLCAMLVDQLCDYVRDNDLSSCATVLQDPFGPYDSPRNEPFGLVGTCTPEEVVERVRSTRVVSGALKAMLARKGEAGSVEGLVRTYVASRPQALAAGMLLSELVGDGSVLDATLGRICHRGARTINDYLSSGKVANRIAAALLENPRYRAQYERSVELRLRVRERVPQTPMDAYPLARTMTRKVVLHVGPTNSGKTHDALKALAAAPSGAYLGPLRLLAYEQFERLNDEGCPCALLTGEERIEVAGARHVSSTVEMADYHTPIDVAVIDEAQMVADEDRDQHWTAAILGIPAQEVHVCCAPHAERVVCQLVGLCGDELEVVRHERLVPLQRDRGRFRLPGDAMPGDALIVFSRKAVHQVAWQIAVAGLRPSIIYGALPYDVRHEEARRFDAGETDVVVATDAIGMGMNLPIRRIVFVDQQKYDGHEMRMLRPQEVQQIAGRAGRFGRYDLGVFQSLHYRKEIFELYDRLVPDITQIPVGIPRNIALVRDATLTESVLQWMAIEQPQPFCRIDMTRDMRLIQVVESMMDEGMRSDMAMKELALALATMPFDEDDRVLWGAWKTMAKAELAGEEAILPLPDVPDGDTLLARLEQDYRYCDLLYNYARSFGHEGRLDELVSRRTAISRTIMSQLAQGSHLH